MTQFQSSTFGHNLPTLQRGLSAIAELLVYSLLELDNSGLTRGHSLKLKKRRFNADLRQHFLTKKRIANIQNSLEDDFIVSIH